MYRSKDRLLKVDDTEFQVVKCSNCGMVYLNPQPTPKEIEKYYPSYYSPYIPHQVFKQSPILGYLSRAKQHMFEDYPRLASTLKKLNSYIHTRQSENRKKRYWLKN